MAPLVADARLTITAVLCAGVVETVGAAVVGVGVPMLLALAPPHPDSKAIDKRIPISTVDRSFMASSKGRKVTDYSHPAGRVCHHALVVQRWPVLRRLQSQRRIPRAGFAFDRKREQADEDLDPAWDSPTQAKEGWSWPVFVNKELGLHPQLPKQERVDIRILFDLLAHRLPGTVTRFTLDAEEDWE